MESGSYAASNAVLLSILFLLDSITIIAAVRPTNAHCIASTAIPISLTMPPLPVIGFPGILVIIHIAMRTSVPITPTPYHTLPHLLSLESPRIAEQLHLRRRV